MRCQLCGETKNVKSIPQRDGTNMNQCSECKAHPFRFMVEIHARYTPCWMVTVLPL